MKKTNKKANKKALVLVLICIILFCSVLFAISVWEQQQNYRDENTTGTTSATEINSDEYTLNKNIETVLVMGLDKFSENADAETQSYKNDQQADFLMLFIIDNQNETCRALHINRDTMAEMDVLGVAGQKVGTVTQQLALSHTYGNGQNVSCRNTANAVSRLLGGVKIDHYVSVTMDAVPIFNDLVGGVTVEVLDDFTGIDDTLIKGEKVTLMGEKALIYVRTRYGMENSTNSNRMIRQKQYIEELYNITRSKIDEDESFILTAWEKMAEYTVSDCYEQDLLGIYEKISGYEYLGTEQLKGESVVGERFMEFYPDEDALNQFVKETFYVPRG
ncbi:MAG: LCP family protein [Clostridia bacterium]|nr:LCP family protein [Clostridia bacterium]